MKGQNIETIERTMEKKAVLRAKKGRPKMKVSGAGVKKLAQIITKKIK